MTDAPSKPKRRRWRWIIGVLLLVCFAVWWIRPRVDARLVGKWKATGGPAVEFFELQANGTATIEPEDRSMKMTTRWFVSDGNFGLSGIPYALSRSFRLIEVAYSRMTGKFKGHPPGSYYEIEDVNAEQVKLRSLGVPRSLILTRLPE